MGGGWLYIAGLWVSEQHRGKGLGETLLAASEKKAIAENCHSAYLYTYDFQAPEFYLKNGYNVFGKLDRFCNNHVKIFMKKRLA
jgi:ribosomal protein S18 acetylase RimI-like enzyme